MNSKILFAILIVILIVLVGCTSSINVVELKAGEDFVYLKEIHNPKLYPYAYISPFINYMPDRYSFVAGISNGKEKCYFFDIKDENLYPIDNNLIRISELNMKFYERYKILQKGNGILAIYDNLSSDEIFSFSPSSYGYDIDAQFLLSNTGKYLQVRSLNTDKSILLDMLNKSIIEIPVDGDIVIEWSDTDSKAIINKLSEDNKTEYEKRYLWDIGNKSYIDIKFTGGESLYWALNDKYLYYVKDSKEIVKYDISKESWGNPYNSGLRSIDVESIKWINDNELVFTGHKRNSSIIPWISYFSQRFKYYAVKADIKSNKTYMKKLNVDSAKEFVFSYDNKYVYYIDRDGMVKEKVDFNN